VEEGAAGEGGKFEMGSVGNRTPNSINYETGECSLTGQLCENIDKALQSLNLGQ